MNNSVRFSFLQDVASLKADDWLRRQAGARAMVASAIGHQLTTQSDSKMDAVAMASPAGALQARPGFKISPDFIWITPAQAHTLPLTTNEILGIRSFGDLATVCLFLF
jgi:hypothetical protein